MKAYKFDLQKFGSKYGTKNTASQCSMRHGAIKIKLRTAQNIFYLSRCLQQVISFGYTAFEKQLIVVLSGFLQFYDDAPPPKKGKRSRGRPKRGT